MSCKSATFEICAKAGFGHSPIKIVFSENLPVGSVMWEMVIKSNKVIKTLTVGNGLSIDEASNSLIIDSWQETLSSYNYTFNIGYSVDGKKWPAFEGQYKVTK